MINQVVLSLLLMGDGAVAEVRMRLAYPEPLLRCILEQDKKLAGNRLLAQCITVDNKEVRFIVTGAFNL